MEAKSSRFWVEREFMGHWENVRLSEKKTEQKPKKQKKNIVWTFVSAELWTVIVNGYTDRTRTAIKEEPYFEPIRDR